MTGATLLSNLSNENAAATIETERQICIQRQSLQEVSVSETSSTPPGHFSLRLRLECCFLCAQTLSGSQLDAFSRFRLVSRRLQPLSASGFRLIHKYIYIYIYFYRRQNLLRKDVEKHRARVSESLSHRTKADPPEGKFLPKCLVV